MEQERTRLDQVREGQSMVLVAAAGGRLWAHALPNGGKLEIGRGDQAQVVIDHSHVLRSHASLLIVGPVVVIEDMGSSNGTWVREQRLSPTERARIEPG